MIKLDMPTRDGETEVVMLRNVPAEDADDCVISDLYRTRWKIETMFLPLTEALVCEANTMCYPKAALYVFACEMVAYNSLSMVKGAINAEHGRVAFDELSHVYMAKEIAEATDGMLVALPEERWLEVNSMPLDEFANELHSTVKQMDLAKYRKSKRGFKKPPPKRTNGSKKTHVSVEKILDARNN